MSFCFDVLERAWSQLYEKLPEETQSGEVAMRFEFMLREVHEANHRLHDAVNHDARLSRCAQLLDDAMHRLSK